MQLKSLNIYIGVMVHEKGNKAHDLFMDVFVLLLSGFSAALIIIAFLFLLFA